MAAAAAGGGGGSKAPKGVLYAHQDELPSLPVPSLEDTLSKFLTTCKPFLNDEEFEHTSAVVEDFKSGAGVRLQALLEEKGREERNWLEQWWEMYAYLQPRYPSACNINWHGVMPGTWGSLHVTQAEAAAVYTRHICQFMQSLQNETLEPETMAGQKLCMNQYTRMFNSCRVPGEEMDEIVEYEAGIRHIVVLYNNAVFSFDVIDEAGGIMSHSDVLAQFERVIAAGTTLFDAGRDPAVSVLTSDERTTWAKARTHLQELDPLNAESLRTVESALFVVALEHGGSHDLGDLARRCLHGDGRNKWFDKPFNLIVFENGRTGVNGEHAWADAMVVVKMFFEVMKSIDAEIKKAGFPAKGSPSASLPAPRKLEWKLDTTITQAIEFSSANISTLIRSIDLQVLEFKHYGKDFIKRYRLIPDFYIQQAIQLAYYRIHGETTAVYESGHTRLFYHGRTDTIKATSVESVAFVKSMCDPTISDTVRFENLKASVSAHLAFTRDVLMGKGIDRHLMGLYILSEMSGLSPKPSLFTDKGFLVSKKYKLSTSNISLAQSPIFGGFMAMYEDGYGVCYGVTDAGIRFSISANNNCPDTSASTFRVALEQALIDMQRLCLSRNVIYVGTPKL